MSYTYNVEVKTLANGEATAHCGKKPKCKGCQIQNGAVFPVTLNLAPRSKGESVHDFNVRADSYTMGTAVEDEFYKRGIGVGHHARTLATEIVSGTRMVLSCPTGDTITVQGSIG